MCLNHIHTHKHTHKHTNTHTHTHTHTHTSYTLASIYYNTSLLSTALHNCQY